MRFGATDNILLTPVRVRRNCAWLLSLVLLFSPGLLTAAQTSATRQLQLEIVHGANATHEDRIPEGKDVAVRVSDDEGHSIAGAAVVFQLPSDGAGGSFPEDSRFATVMTDAEGVATAKGFQPNTQPGPFKITVTASYRDFQSATTAVMQTNGEAVAKPDVAVERKGSGKVIAIAVIIAGAAAGLALGLGGGGGGSSPPSGPTPPPPVVITPGTPTFGGP